MIGGSHQKRMTARSSEYPAKNATIVHNDGIGMVAGVACPHLWTLNTIMETGDN